MSIKKIENGRYWNAAWQLVDGCTPCSPGCDHCWAAGIERRFGDGWLSLKDGRFNGRVRPHPERLDVPLKRRRPTVFAVWNDLFHEAVPWSFRDKVYAMMQKRNNHQYLILTKRPEQMRNYVLSAMFDENCNYEGIYEEMEALGVLDDAPLADNVWHGITVCNQAEAEEKIPVFLQVPGKKFLSIEPMLGAVDLGLSLFNIEIPDHFDRDGRKYSFEGQEGIDAVILGGETGPGARPMHPDWVRSVRDQCQAAAVPLFFKQWGEWMHESMNDFNSSSGAALSSRNAMYHTWLGGTRSFRVGKERSGRLLDGRTHDDLPWHHA